MIHVHIQYQQNALKISHCGEANISFFCLSFVWYFSVLFVIVGLPDGEQWTFVFFGHFTPVAPSVVCSPKTQTYSHVHLNKEIRSWLFFFFNLITLHTLLVWHNSIWIYKNIMNSFHLCVDFFKGANLQGVKMLCSNAEGASLKGCNFEDPSGLKANLEGNPSQLFITVEAVSHL